MNYSQSAYGVRLADNYAASSVAAAVDKTVFLVARIDYTEGVDPIRIYVNPQPGTPEPATASASLINYDVQVFTRLSLTGPGGSAFDAIRIGTTYADVAPATSDFNDDGKVDHFDYATWQVNFGLTGGIPQDGDANNDSDADGSDFLVWQRQRGFAKPTSASVVPEPTTGIIMVGLALLFARRRR